MLRKCLAQNRDRTCRSKKRGSRRFRDKGRIRRRRAAGPLNGQRAGCAIRRNFIGGVLVVKSGEQLQAQQRDDQPLQAGAFAQTREDKGKPVRATPVETWVHGKFVWCSDSSLHPRDRRAATKCKLESANSLMGWRAPINAAPDRVPPQS